MNNDAVGIYRGKGQPVRPHYFEFDAHRNRELRARR